MVSLMKGFATRVLTACSCMLTSFSVMIMMVSPQTYNFNGTPSPFQV